MVVISSVNMEGKLDVIGKTRVFHYTGAKQALVIYGVSATEVQAVLAHIDGDAPAREETEQSATPVPPAAVVFPPPDARPPDITDSQIESTAEAFVKEAEKAPKKSTKVKKKAEPKKRTETAQEPSAEVEATTAEPSAPPRQKSQQGASNGHSGRADAPIDAMAQLDARESRVKPEVEGEIQVVEVGSVMAADTDLSDSGEEDIPEGWERCRLDGKMQLVHTACGGTTCLCYLSSAETDEAESSPSADESESEEEVELEAAEDAEDEVVEDETTDEPVAAADDDGRDPLIAELKSTSRLLHVLDAIIKTGMRDEDEIFAKCEELKPHVPVLARITPATWPDRIRRAIGVTLPPQ